MVECLSSSLTGMSPCPRERRGVNVDPFHWKERGPHGHGLFLPFVSFQLNLTQLSVVL